MTGRLVKRKLLLLGEIGVGKTSIVRRLVFDRHDADYKATVGTDVYRYEVAPSPATVPFHFIVWDTDGNFGESIFRTVHMKEAGPKKVSWSFIDGEFMKDNKGGWVLEDAGEGKTKATYSIAVEVGMLVPKTIVNALVDTQLPKLLENFKKRIEAQK